MAPPEVRCASYDGSSYNQPHSTNGIWAPSERAPSGELDQRTQQLSLSYLFGPGWLLTGTHALLVMVQRLLLQGPLLLPLMLEGNQVVPLLLQLPLKSFRLPLLFQLLALVLLPRAGRAKRARDHMQPQCHAEHQQSMQWRQRETGDKQNSEKDTKYPQVTPGRTLVSTRNGSIQT